MPSAPLERLSTRASLVIGVLVTLALWLYTGYSFSRRLDEVERQAASVAARYLRAQEMLTTVRTQVLVSSVRVRDAMLNPDPSALAVYREQVEASFRTIEEALTAYVPVVGRDEEHAEIARLRREVEDFREVAGDMLSESPKQTTAEIRELLNSFVVPRREAAVRISEEVQTLNRAAFLGQQGELDGIHRVAEQESLRRLGVAIAISIGVLLLAALYAVRLERRLRSENEHSVGLTRELQEATMRVMHAQATERRTLARELHDEVGQVLMAVKVELSLAAKALEARGLPTTPLDDAQNITAGAIGTIRDISQLLHPSTLDDLGLVAAVEGLLRGMARRQEVGTGFTHAGLDTRLDPATEVATYRIVQEALTNVARHARASQCQVHLERHADRLELSVTDDGVGFVRSPAGSRSTGIGLLGIRERVAELEGVFDITSAPGSGTTVTVRLPLKRHVPPEAACA